MEGRGQAGSAEVRAQRARSGDRSGAQPDEFVWLITLSDALIKMLHALTLCDEAAAGPAPALWTDDSRQLRVVTSR